ncbi:hypothetical protein FWH09_00095, partial [Candidatus Saccharibacteria bacterium]|nr:hypothetical protein [Candidatus Saccharibacteria bacterium]
MNGKQNEMERRAKLVAEGRKRLEALRAERGSGGNERGNSRGDKTDRRGSNNRGPNGPRKQGTPQPNQKGNTPKPRTSSGAKGRQVILPVKARHGEVMHAQKMVSSDVNAKATQHIVGIPVNKSRYNGYNGAQVTGAKLKVAKPDPDAVRIIPMGGLGELGI